MKTFAQAREEILDLVKAGTTDMDSTDVLLLVRVGDNWEERQIISNPDRMLARVCMAQRKLVEHMDRYVTAKSEGYTTE